MLSDWLRMRRASSRWNPLDMGSGIILSSDRRTASVAFTKSVRGDKSRAAGILQFEIKVGTVAPFGGLLGVGTSAASLNVYPGGSSGGWGYWGYNGEIYREGSPSSYGVTYAANDVIGVVVNFTTGTLTFYKNGTSQGVASSSMAGKNLFPICGAASSTSDITNFTINTGDQPFIYPISGAMAWG